MTRLIDADALKLNYEQTEKIFWDNKWHPNIPKKYIDQAPTIRPTDARAHWIVRNQKLYCGECNKESSYTSWGTSEFSDFCPHCGAMMGGCSNG